MAHETILIVEDDNDLREALTTALTTEGFTVEQADNGADGFAKAVRIKPNLILMDIMMPNMNGHEALAKIRNDRWGKNAKVVFLTALSDAENVVHAVKKGSEEYIVKSNTSLAEIVATVKRIVHGY